MDYTPIFYTKNIYELVVEIGEYLQTWPRSIFIDSDIEQVEGYGYMTLAIFGEPNDF
jgi:hypothetical protein